MKRGLFHFKRATGMMLVLVVLCLYVPTGGQQKPKEAAAGGAEAQKFIDEYTAQYLKLRYIYQQAEWSSNTKIVEGDQTNARATNDFLRSRSITKGNAR